MLELWCDRSAVLFLVVPLLTISLYLRLVYLQTYTSPIHNLGSTITEPLDFALTHSLNLLFCRLALPLTLSFCTPNSETYMPVPQSALIMYEKTAHYPDEFRKQYVQRKEKAGVSCIWTRPPLAFPRHLHLHAVINVNIAITVIQRDYHNCRVRFHTSTTTTIIFTLTPPPPPPSIPPVAVQRVAEEVGGVSQRNHHPLGAHARGPRQSHDTGPGGFVPNNAVQEASVVGWGGLLILSLLFFFSRWNACVLASVYA